MAPMWNAEAKGGNMKHPACVGMKDSVRIRSIFGAAIIALMLCTSCEALFTNKFWGTRPVYSHDPPQLCILTLVKRGKRPKEAIPRRKISLSSWIWKWGKILPHKIRYGNRRLSMIYEADEGQPSNTEAYIQYCTATVYWYSMQKREHWSAPIKRLQAGVTVSMSCIKIIIYSLIRTLETDT